MQPREGYQLERQANYAVALRLDIDDELLREGIAREVIHAVQNARKVAGLDVEDRIELVLRGDEELLGVVRQHADYVAGETLAAACGSTEYHSTRPTPSRLGSAGSDLEIALGGGVRAFA